jgi:hypothetical protein
MCTSFVWLARHVLLTAVALQGMQGSQALLGVISTSELHLGLQLVYVHFVESVKVIVLLGWSVHRMQSPQVLLL